MAELLISPELEDTVSLSLHQDFVDLAIDEISLNNVDKLHGIQIKDLRICIGNYLMITIMC